MGQWEDSIGVELGDSPDSASWILGLKTNPTMLDSLGVF